MNSLSAPILLVCLLSVGIVFKRRRLGVVELFAILFTYFFLGPYFAFIMEFDVYSGIKVLYLEDALQVFLVAMGSFLIGSWLGSRRRRLLGQLRYSSIDIPSKATTRLATLYPAIALLLFGLVRAAVTGSFSASKSVAITMMGWTHYPTLTLVPCLMFAYMSLTPSSKRVDIALLTTLLLFSIYSLSTNERDFVLILLPIYLWMYRSTKVKVIHAVAAVFPLIFLFTFLSLGRSYVLSDDLSSSGQTFLNQGSNLMVITQVLSYIEEGGRFLCGLTYMSALVNAATLGAVSLWGPGSVWLSEYYSGGVGAYGFSLEGEAFLNFGFWGVCIAFFLLGLIACWIERSAENSQPIGRLLLFCFCYFFIYAIRGESLLLLKSTEYSLIILTVVSIISKNKMSSSFTHTEARQKSVAQRLRID